MEVFYGIIETRALWRQPTMIPDKIRKYGPDEDSHA